jgi:hypothetical protein
MPLHPRAALATLPRALLFGPLLPDRRSRFREARQMRACLDMFVNDPTSLQSNET